MDEKAVNGGTEMPIQFVGRDQVKGIIPDNLQGEYGKAGEDGVVPLCLVGVKDQKINAQDRQDADTIPAIAEEEDVFEIREDDSVAGWVGDVLQDLGQAAAEKFTGRRERHFEIQRNRQREEGASKEGEEGLKYLFVPNAQTEVCGTEEDHCTRDEQK